MKTKTLVNFISLMVLSISLFAPLSLIGETTAKPKQSFEFEDYVNPLPFPKDRLPAPVFDAEPGFVDLYWRAWEIAWNHVKEQEGVPQSPYMDEAFWKDTIWIWDTCFMVHFCKYGNGVFPGVESFENFYQIMHGEHPSALFIQHPDNPPLFAWIEDGYYQFTGDQERVRNVMEQELLTTHYRYFEENVPGTLYDYAGRATLVKRLPLGYLWDGDPSGMDNTPRGGEKKDTMLWLDALAQQALSAKHIAAMAESIGDEVTADTFKDKFEELKELANTYYWDEEDQFYYDISSEPPHRRIKVKTPASYWMLLAGIASPEQARAMAEHAADPKVFGGDIPWPSVSFDDPEFQEKGMYWRGGVWLPTAYMATKALEAYGYHELANQHAYHLIKHMLDTYNHFEPHTIWECYNPTEPLPAKAKKNEEWVRPNFCGWSALGPISMFIENVLGFHKIDGVNRQIHWNLQSETRTGIKNLVFSDITTSIVAEAGRIQVTASADYTLIVNGNDFAVIAGENEFSL